MSDGDIRIDTKIDQAQLDRDLRNLNSRISHSLKGIESLTSKFKTGLSLAAIAAGIRQIAQDTAALENSIRAASTLFGDVSVNVSNLRDRILSLSSETGIAADQIGNALYEALSSGVPVTEDMGIAMDFLRSSAAAAKGGFADLSETVTATAAVINAYGLSVEDAERVQGVMIQTQNLGMTTIGQLASSLAQVIPTASAFGVSFEQIGAALATSTAAGTQTSQAITGLNQLLSELGKQGQVGAENLALAAEAAGLGATTFTELTASGMTLAEILTVMEDYAESTDKTLIDLFGSVEAGRTALQLAGANTERFESNLEAMGNTAGLTAAAAASVTTGVEKLANSLSNAVRSIGSFFEPTVQDVAGMLADMIDSFTGNTSEAENLDTALGNVKLALERYKTAQENAKTATDETSAAMAEQSQEAFIRALTEMGTALADAERAMRSNASDISTANNVIDDMNLKLDGLANQAGISREELDHLGRSLLLDENIASDWQRWTDEIVEQEVRIDSLSGGYDRLKENMASSMQEAAEMYSEGFAEVIDGLSATNAKAANEVIRLANAYSAGNVEAMEYGEITLENMEASEDYITTLMDELDTVELGSTRYSYLKGQIDSLTESYNELAKATGKPLIGVVPKASGGGSGGTPSSSSGDDIGASLDSKLAASSEVEARLGEYYDENSAKIAAYKSAIRDYTKEMETMAASGNATSEELDAMADKVKDLSAELSNTEGWEQFGANMEAFAKGSATSFMQTMGSAFSDSISSLFTIDERVAEIDELIAEKEDERAAALEEVNEKQKEYDEAVLLGNETDIAAAEDALKIAEDKQKGLDENIKSLKEEREATASGEDAWHSLGKAALEALADILMSLGHQLAAEAVAQMISMNWVQAGIATAGSIAAYVASGIVSGLAAKYATGGIVPKVPGVPSTGDQHLARVNPGELILNQAQQENIAALLTTRDVAAEMQRDSYSSSTIVIRIDGDIYGLDSEEVGRAVYRNIKSLQTEGVIGSWD